MSLVLKHYNPLGGNIHTVWLERPATYHKSRKTSVRLATASTKQAAIKKATQELKQLLKADIV
jgi:hypothetical protein